MAATLPLEINVHAIPPTAATAPPERSTRPATRFPAPARGERSDPAGAPGQGAGSGATPGKGAAAAWTSGRPSGASEGCSLMLTCWVVPAGMVTVADRLAKPACRASTTVLPGLT